LSVYAFENIYPWKGLFEIYWQMLDGCLCVFFKDRLGSFLYLPPLGGAIKPQAIAEAFKIMHSLNKNREISRIENVEEGQLLFYRALGCECKAKFSDYLYKREPLANLRGNKLKHKRASLNYFLKHYKFQYLPFSLRYRDDCLRLYEHWSKERKCSNQDSVYKAMLEDNKSSLETMLKDYRRLGYIGRLVKIGGSIKAFSFGFKLNNDTFCIAYEITDLSIKGLAQFIFREFCRELKEYKYINIMDDSGLENLKKVKLSYQPHRLILSYIVTEKNA
ncbi:MAG TPA: phosphatidylglycerol lysyltransferase domain-containing protein, partial [Candidatus Omnitrophota bacterium]|nr:phosphatidylglycerol lysyltransferase domain-containing protein [Candidatus Omnitrophota bacterium]